WKIFSSRSLNRNLSPIRFLLVLKSRQKAHATPLVPFKLSFKNWSNWQPQCTKCLSPRQKLRTTHKAPQALRKKPIKQPLKVHQW
ncbi:HAMP domain protein, partial [Vibrio parahaemolyticus V-223/04]